MSTKWKPCVKCGRDGIEMFSTFECTHPFCDFYNDKTRKIWDEEMAELRKKTGPHLDLDDPWGWDTTKPGIVGAKVEAADLYDAFVAFLDEDGYIPF